MQDLAELFKDSRLVALITDNRGQIVSTTPGAEKAQGTLLSDLMGISLPPASEDRSLLRSFSQLRSADAMHVVLLLNAGAGQILTLHVEDFALREATGESRGWFVAGQEFGRSQAEARCTQSILSTLLDSIGAAFWAFDRAGTIATWSRPCETYFGVSRADAEGKLSTGRLFADPEALRSALKEVDSGGRFVGQLDLLDRTGAPRPNHVTINRLSTAQDETLGYACVSFDVTDRRRLEEFQRVLFDESRSGMLLAEGENLRVISSNAEAARVLGLAAERITGARLTDLFPEFDPAAARRETVGDQAGRDGVYERSWMLASEGHPRDLEGRTRVIRMGVQEYFLTEVRDISERVRAASQLASANAFLEKLRDEAPDAIFLVDEQGVFQYTNASGGRLLGRDRDSLLGRTLDEVAAPERIPLHREILRKVLEGEPARFLTTLLRPDGSAVSVDVGASLIVSGDRRFALGIVRETTEPEPTGEKDRAALGNLEQQMREQAEELERLRGAFREESAERERAERSLRDALESASRQEAAISSLLKQDPFRQSDPIATIRALLEHATRLMDAERAGLWRFLPGDSVLRAVGVYERKTERLMSGQKLSAEAFPAWFQSLGQGEILAVTDAARDARTRDFWKEHLASAGIVSVLALPVHARRLQEGVLLLESGPERAWEAGERALASALAGLAGLLLLLLERFEAERRLAVRSAVTQVLAEAATMDEAAPRVLKTLCEVVGWDAVGLWIVDRATDTLRCTEFASRSSRSAPEMESASRQAVLAPGADLPGRVRASGAPAWIPDVAKDAAFGRGAFASRDGLHAAAAVPVASGLQILGVLELFHAEERDPEPALLEELAAAGLQLGRFMERRASEAETLRRVEEARLAYEELKRAQSQLIRSEKLASISMLLSGFAREMNDPLGAIRGSLEQMVQTSDEIDQNLRGRKPAEVRKGSRALKGTLRSAEQAAKRAMGMLEDFGELARDPRSGEPTDLLPCIEEAVGLLPAKALKGRIKIVQKLKPIPPVRCIPSQMVQVFHSILQNAVESIEKKGSIEIRTETLPAAAVIEIADKGGGMGDDVQARIFDPFFTTKPDHAGMGLATSAMIVQNHGGKIDVQSQPKKGTVVRIELPAGARK